MVLAPIRGAPPGAPNPDFPIEEPKVRPEQPITSAPVDAAQLSPTRQRHAPIVIGDGDITFTFRVIPEQPVIARASMTIHIVAEAAGSSSSRTLGFLRMSASNARLFLTDLRNGRFPIAVTGDEDGTVQIECESTEVGPVLLVRKPGEQYHSYRVAIAPRFDLKVIGDELLADMGT